MTNTKRFIAVAVTAIALIGASGAEAKPAGPTVLVNQMGAIEAAPGWDPLSQHKPDGTEIQSAADDFVVPNRRAWKLTSVEVGGSRITQSTTSSLLDETPSFDVTVYKADGNGGGPGTVVAAVRAEPTSTSCCVDASGQLLALPDVALASGRYWISVAYVHDPLLDSGKWYWRGYNSENGSFASYRSPSSGGWQSLQYPHDLEMRLSGTVSHA